MIKLTDIAAEKIREHFGDNEPQPIRVYLGGGGCAGPQLMLAIDEKNEEDAAFSFDNITLLAQKELLDATGTVTVDANDYGFQVASENPIAAGGGCDCSSGCGSGCGC